MKKLLFVINPKAGLKKNKHFIDEAVEIFENAGYKVGIKFTKKRSQYEQRRNYNKVIKRNRKQKLKKQQHSHIPKRSQ